ncbi:MAG: response regulator [Deltaproteobacteria bacterium]|nr:response regulator [Deltaproteobacteria bacterium]
MARKTILIVDDDRDVQVYLRKALETDGWKILVESDGDWGLKTFESTDVDVLILDILLPVVNGLQVAAAIRDSSKGQNVPIIMLSGVYRGKEHRVDAIERFGLLDYLNKPVEVAAIRRLLKVHFGEDYPSAPERGQGKSDGTRSKRYSTLLADAAARSEKREVERETRALSAQSVSMRGNLKETEFARLLNELYRTAGTGALFLMKGKVKKILYLFEGRPVSVKSNLLQECLGQMLVQEGILTAEECARSLERMQESGRLQGTELVSMRLLTPQDLVEALQRQLKLKILQVFAWLEGEYQFKENAKVPPGEISLGCTSATLIYEGVRLGMPPERVAQLLAPMMHAYAAPARDVQWRYQVMELETQQEADLVKKINGSRTVQKLIEEMDLGADLGLALMYALVASGIVELWDRPMRLPTLRPSLRGEPVLDESDVQSHLAAELVSLKGKNYFQILGVGPDADPLELDDAFLERATTFHPDRYFQFGEVTRSLAENLFAIFQSAYDKVTAVSLGEDVAEAEQHPDMDEYLTSAVLSLAAGRHFEEGKALLGKGKAADATRSLEKAVSLEPRQAKYWVYRGWALYQEGERDQIEDARSFLDRAIELDSSLDRAHLFLGYLLEDQEQLQEAQESFERALHCNPQSREAAKALDALAEKRKMTSHGPGSEEDAG